MDVEVICSYSHAILKDKHLENSYISQHNLVCKLNCERPRNSVPPLKRDPSFSMFLIPLFMFVSQRWQIFFFLILFVDFLCSFKCHYRSEDATIIVFHIRHNRNGPIATTNCQYRTTIPLPYYYK